MPFVLDSSVTLSWMLPDESTPTLDALFDHLTHERAYVPPVWPLEIGNVLLLAVKRKRLTARDLGKIVSHIQALPIDVDQTSTAHSLEETLSLAQRYNLTTYDASFIELAKRRDIPLATIDKRLRQACSSAKIPILPS